jgi:hypothetical protein
MAHGIPPGPAGDAPRRKRGCLTGCFTFLIGLFVAGCIFVLLVDAAFAPWAFYMGGHFHVLPYWQGWGRMKSATAGDFVLYAQMYPAPDSYPYMHSHATGNAYLCTPRGERYWLQLGGDMPRHMGIHVTGQPLYLYMYYRPPFRALFTADRRPRFELHGTWGESEIVMDDRKTLMTAFWPDGRVYMGNEPNHPSGTEDISVTLREGSYSDFKAACAVAAAR